MSAASLLPELNPESASATSTIYIATVRKDGKQSAAVPVWFTVTRDGAILIQTRPASWLVRRIKRGSPVIVWIGKPGGPAFIGTAKCSVDAEVVNRIIADYRKKYLLARIGIYRPTARSFAQGRRIAIEIRPTRSLPPGFISQPGAPAPIEPALSTDN
jgi:hypothetical protein